jgi:hypothetical protein
MIRPLLPFRRHFCVGALSLLSLVVLLAYARIAGNLPAEAPAEFVLLPSAVLFVLVAVAACVRAWRSRWFWRFAGRVCRFRTYSTPRVVLHYAPRLQDSWDFAVFCERCVSELDDLEGRFGFRLRRRLVVYLFPGHAEVSEVFGEGYAGTALAAPCAVVIPNNMNVQAALRHEVTHLLSARWNRAAPPLLNEGLATYLEDPRLGGMVDRAARSFVDDPELALSRLLSRSFFYSLPRRHSCYVLAGSFTAFLIRRFGWDDYRTFFRKADSKNFKRTFQKCFEFSLEEAERLWRDELRFSIWGSRAVFGR